MRYFQQSEQIVTMTQVACVLDGERVKAAGGFVIQLLPELTEPPLQKMTELLQEFGSLHDWLNGHGDDPAELRRTLLKGQEFTHLADDPVRFACPCDENRAVSAIATLQREELQELIDQGGELPVDCDYCAERYVMREEHFRRVIAAMDESGD
jgi:molecular chaperone Hsp33